MYPSSIAERGAIAPPLPATWSGKGRTLLWLRPQLRASTVPPSECIDFATWRLAPHAVLQGLAARFGAQALVVRSARADEDGAAASHAGRYLTCFGVDAAAARALAQAIDRVFASYAPARRHDEVLIQPQVAARLAAVAATHAVEDGADYYVFSLVESARTDAVTRGDAPVRTVYIARDAPPPREPDLASLYAALREVEALCPERPLEAELVIGDDGVVLLQARPLARATSVPEPAAAQRRRQRLQHIGAALATPDPTCHGGSRLLALMPDWNPAELLGAHPRPLALDIFVRVIGQDAWRRARAAFGYRRLGAVALLQPFAGRPYVDVCASANSLLPRGLPAASATALVDAWQARLGANPSLHDRYEFAIAQTCVDFSFDADFRARYAGVLDADALAGYRGALAQVTRRCLDPRYLQLAYRRFDRLEAWLDSASASTLPAGLLLAQAVRDGATPFAVVARQAFALEALLRSAVARGALSAQRLLAAQQGCSTAATEFLRVGAAGPAALRRRFGFLRAGTFEVSTPRLAHLEIATSVVATAPDAAAVALTAGERRDLAQLLAEAGYAIAPDALLQHYLLARRGREHGKYVLSRAISALLEHIAAAAARRGVDRETLSWLTLAQWRDGADSSLLQQAAQARRQHAVDALLRLPPVLDPRQSLGQVLIDAGVPTFVGAGRVSAPLRQVSPTTAPASVPVHAALAIDSADPGYDWIFARAPAALITAYGGPNSHMAIRCAELGVPAVLGLGIERWRRLIAGDHLALDLATQSITSWTADFS